MKIDLKFNNQRYSGFGGFVMRTIVLTLATIIAIRFLPGVRIVDGSVMTAIFTALVIAVLDNFVRPILVFITLPFTIITLGLFIFIINAIIIKMTAAIVPAFQVDSFGYALLFSLIITLLNYLLELPNRWLGRGRYHSRSEDNTTPNGTRSYDDEDEFSDYEEVD
ncbi:MAG: phage holin family protein [Bacteroidales bacterium]|nr:phage holin family protein [Bacteroidales bacterium]